MASLRLQPPNPFNSWSPYMLLYCLGEADDILTSTNITEEDHKKVWWGDGKFWRIFLKLYSMWHWKQHGSTVDASVKRSQPNSTSLTVNDIHRRFPWVFEGLGQFREEWDKTEPSAVTLILLTSSHTSTIENKGCRGTFSYGDIGGHLKSRPADSMVRRHSGRPKKE